MEAMEQTERIQEILTLAREKNASDVHLGPGSPVMYRIDGALVPLDDRAMSPDEVWSVIEPILGEKNQAILKENGEVDFAFSLKGFSRLRVNVFRQRGTYAMALRILSFRIPAPEELGIPESVVDLTSRKRGLVLVTGATGSGKSTTLASLLNIIAENYPKNIITLEDPIEYLYNHKKAMVSQREIGADTNSYSNALRAALRQDPDVLLVGEMRDLDTISIAITAAETGHLVFSTLHTNNSASTIDRIIDVFPPHQQQQIRVQLAGVLEGIISQQLMPRQKTGGRVAAFEVMLATNAVRNLVREGKSHQIPSVIQTSKKQGMNIMDDAIFDLYMKSYISAETAVTYAQDPAGMSHKVTFR